MGIRMSGIEVKSMTSLESNMPWLSKARTGFVIASSLLFLATIYPPLHWAWVVGAALYLAGVGTFALEWWQMRAIKKRAKQNMQDFMTSGAGEMIANAAMLAASIRQEMYMGDDTLALSVEATIVNGALHSAKIVTPTLVPGSVECVLVVDGGIAVRLLDSEDKSLKWRVMEIARERIPGSEIAFEYND